MHETIDNGDCLEPANQLTILSTTDKKLPLTKTHNLTTGGTTPYAKVKQFHCKQVDCVGIDALYRLLAELNDSPQDCIVNGQPIAEWGIKNARNSTTLLDREITFLPLDIDGVVIDKFDPNNCNTPDIVTQVLDKIGLSWMSHYSYVWAWTSSVMSPSWKGDARLRLWFELDKPVGLRQLRAWATPIIGLDASIYSPSQIIYTAAPVFTKGGEALPDPIKQRIGFEESFLGDVIPRKEITALSLVETTPPPLADFERQSLLLSVDKSTIDDLKSALAVIPADDYSQWIPRTGQALASLKGGDYEQAVLDLFLEYSAKFEGYDELQTVDKWGTLQPNHIDYRVVFKDAEEYGWINPQSKAGKLKSAKDAIQRAITAAKDGDVGAPFEPDSLEALAILLKHDTPEYQRTLNLLRGIKGVSITDLKKSINRATTNHDEINQMDVAHQTIAVFGDGNLLHNLGSFWQWCDNGVWSRVHDDRIKQAVHGVVSDELITSHLVDAVTRLIRTHTYQEDVQLGDKFDGINCLNGELYLEGDQWRLEPHNKENYLISQIPVRYDPDAQAPVFDQFLNSVFEGDYDRDDKIQALLELIGYTLVSHCRYSKFALLIGGGANGKSVLLDTLQALCGKANVAAVKPSSMGSVFQLAHLQGKLANIVSELKKGEVVDDAALKSLTSGETQTAERKNKDPFEFNPYATCWFSTNHMPHTRDVSHALSRRALVIEFNNTFNEDSGKCDPLLTSKLAKELSGILNRALQALAVATKRGHILIPESTEQARKQWLLEADSVAQFVDECCDISPEAKSITSEFYSQYEQWCSIQGITKVSGKSLGSRLKNIKGVTTGSKNGRGDKKIYKGISIKKEVLIDDDFLN